MSRLIMNSLSKLRNGDAVSVTYGDVTHPETIFGTVAENETEYDGGGVPVSGTIVLTDEAGQESFVSYNIVHGLKQLGKTAPSSTASAPPRWPRSPRRPT